MSPSCRTAFRLLVHESLLQYSRSSNVLALKRTLAHISARYPCTSSSWTQWEKNNNRPNQSQELRRILAWPSSYYSNYPCSFFVFMGNLVSHDVLASLIYFYFIYTLFLLYKFKRYMCVRIVRKCSSLRRKVKPSLACFFWDCIPYVTTNLINSKCCIQHTYYRG